LYRLQFKETGWCFCRGFEFFVVDTLLSKLQSAVLTISSALYNGVLFGNSFIAALAFDGESFA